MPQTTPRQPDHAPRIEGFDLLRKIAGGAFSEVWLAEQTGLRRQVAIKIMLPQALADEVSRRRFESEARTLAALEHPGIVGILQVGRSADGLPWYAMPYLAHGHLAQRDYRNDPATVRRILDVLLDALGHAHANGVVHRDIKAENVLFDERDQPLLADFGIALRRGHGARVTGFGMAVGSTAYMAPEQGRGLQVDGRADLYSIGVLGWEMLTGALPYQADDALAMALAHAREPIPKLPHALRRWQGFFNRALAKEPTQRFQDASAMRAALAKLDIGQAGVQRQRLGTWSLLAITLGVAGTGLLLWWMRQQPTTAPSISAAPAASTQAQPATASPNGMAATAVSGHDPLQQPLPASSGEWQIEAARRQLQADQLIAPSGDNALESLKAAAALTPPPPELARIAGQAHLATLDALEKTINAGDTAAARKLLPSLVEFDRMAQADTHHPRTARQQRIVDALNARIDLAANHNDRNEARSWAALARDAGLNDARQRALRERSDRIVQVGDSIQGVFGGARLERMGGRLVGIPARPVSRTDFAQFVQDTQRPPSSCRQSGSPLRVLAPRDWRRPGFEQPENAPVACVSWQDATAYAQWLSHRTGRNYRLPMHNEVARLPTVGGEHAMSLWLHDCGSDCNQRQVSGRSWREQASERALDNRRGWDDVTFALMLEP